MRSDHSVDEVQTAAVGTGSGVAALSPYDRLLAGALVLVAPLAICFILLHVAWGMVCACGLFPYLPVAVSDWLVQFWSRVLLAALGIRVQLCQGPRQDSSQDQAAGGLESARGALLLINHTSWVDVFVVASIVPTRFVAKAEIARWTLLGRFAAAVGTIYVERGRRHAVGAVNRAVVERLRSGQCVGIFPEGTTTDGARLLRFHASLVQPAIEAPAPALPVALQYRQDGQPTTAAAFIGTTTLVASLWRILITPCLTAHVHSLPAIDATGQSRHAIAAQARLAVAQALQLDPALEPAPTLDAVRGPH